MMSSFAFYTAITVIRARGFLFVPSCFGVVMETPGHFHMACGLVLAERFGSYVMNNHLYAEIKTCNILCGSKCLWICEEHSKDVLGYTKK